MRVLLAIPLLLILDRCSRCRTSRRCSSACGRPTCPIVVPVSLAVLWHRRRVLPVRRLHVLGRHAGRAHPGAPGRGAGAPIAGPARGRAAPVDGAEPAAAGLSAHAMAKVKICGVNTPEALAAAAAAGADWVGFVFFPPSPRFVTPEQAAAISATHPGGPARVGLFVDPTDDAVASGPGPAKPIRPADLRAGRARRGFAHALRRARLARGRRRVAGRPAGAHRRGGRPDVGRQTAQRRDPARRQRVAFRLVDAGGSGPPRSPGCSPAA